MYIPIFVMQMKKEQELGFFYRVVVPALGVIASAFMVLAAIVSLRKAVLYYLILFAVLMGIGLLLKNYGHEEE